MREFELNPIAKSLFLILIMHASQLFLFDRVTPSKKASIDGFNFPVIAPVNITAITQGGRSADCSGYQSYRSQWNKLMQEHADSSERPRILHRPSCNMYSTGDCDVDIVHLHCFNHPVKGWLFVVNTHNFTQDLTWATCKKSNKPCQNYETGLNSFCRTTSCTLGNVLTCQGSNYFWTPMILEDCVCK